MQVLSSTTDEERLSFEGTDISTLYIIQHELLRNQDVEFAGVIVKHPLTNECWMRVSSKANPRQNITDAAQTALETAEEMRNALNADVQI